MLWIDPTHVPCLYKNSSPPSNHHNSDTMTTVNPHNGLKTSAFVSVPAPVCCKPPRYGPHESIVMEKLVKHLDDNGLTEPDDGPWGALIVLAAKPNQDDTPWHQYIWRLCVSFRRLNQVTKPFAFPIPRCDDAVSEIPPTAKYFIAFDLDCGYWQILVDEESREK